ncbi:C6 transcription factor, putative [Aspergillus fumigatus Af293]|uniref:Transcription factor hmgR n=1 Tax=Aspergillus fumigatus (strain ATCC MYA-4609 / CBS 101355 / FGSC A1100 / Af293) TaxID=330879 RepID=HMGR_ASPFU|nr:C6 transcription factor, putative [Aspergillus fumigatus Af293]A4D9U3.1 RecName: Full=Transcription factor hmgR; AltName: Full=L-tyrosine degradation gene cluster protein hmgR; AltName: Full=Pyomelanin biosynthesis cluster protein hmgR [Aspergillus fumigatus Af293]EBA27314.1 C6 transcription factor, putative [Aspergillus fumigatus Af293]
MEIRRPSRHGNHPDRTYQRTYKACISCRQRKAKCDLGTGPDGLPLGPPCAKCRREQKPCLFDEKRAWERVKKRGTQSTSNLANSMMRTVVSSGNDALNILFEAANAQSQEDSMIESDSLPETEQHRSGHPVTSEGSSNQIDLTVPPDVLEKAMRPVELSHVSKDVLSTWEACRFVRMGWFTAREAVTFIDLFFKNMSILSPVLTDFYADHKNHRWLIAHDPVLCCTILMISSRYHVLPGVGGQSRNFFIHHRLWQHCQQLVTRLIFGQELSSQPKIRNIGTIEALLLMSDWHPRSLHFPPESDGWDSDLVTIDLESTEYGDDGSNSSAKRWAKDMSEPAKRSDQMSWMLLGSALSLAHELGIYETGDKARDAFVAYERFMTKDQMRLRRQRAQRLLYVYINQLAWRIGCVSLMPQGLSHSILNRQTSRELSQYGEEWLTFMDSWMDLTKLAKSVTDMFFPSVTFARQQLQSGRYIDLLDHFRPLLDKWKERYLQPQLHDKPFYDDIFIEYHFVRVYTHSVGMQAVVERAIADGNADEEEVRPMNIDPIDYEYIQEVIDGCCQILEKVTQLADIGALRFSPVRIFVRITSASIFLMKALSLGARQAKLRESLDVLERTIQALRSNALDDIHLSTRYATLLETHVSRLRRHLVASCKSLKRRRESTTRHSMVPPSYASATSDEHAPLITNPPVPQNMSDMGFTPSLNDIAADDWLSLPFDPSMAPFSISSGGQFPAYEGGGLNFLWNLPS